MFNCKSCTASVILHRDISTALNKCGHIQRLQEFVEIHLIGVALEARKGRLCYLKGILCSSCLRLFLCVDFVCEFERFFF